ncbi:helix-turn-helix domain-containing protein [Streptomyces neyagawaensis]|uniref:AraC-like ligand-binding domain-containing protein n=1 Tax=Streptomyces neyagawaensis TaxID=42238 RepID=UPI00147036DB|nr:helix-turn-helix domain-containing protein [Streptomyces neyagawaensis]MCL6737478.1 helix-turn-helix domain-containing protein [Streptomyces neyagawaensis]MDE1688237.1 helix-turn-helix domain-containing protein [Streptomyces neyagawaensis]
MGVRSASSPEEWAHLISESFVPLSLANISGAFHGSVEQTVLLPGVTVTDVHTHGHSVVLRTPRLTRVEPREYYLFSLHLGGAGAVLQDEREATLHPGTGALYDATRPYQLVFPTDTREIVLQVPRRSLRERVGAIDELSGRVLPADNPAARVFSAFLRELVGVSEQLALEQRAELGWTVVDLLATALRATVGAEPSAPTGRQTLLQAMRSSVLEHLSDPAFTSAALARRHGISLRYAADLFTEAGTSPAAYIRDQRLKAAHRALRDPRQSHRTIAAIAAGLGFTDRTTFTRAFVRQYGVTPADLRAGQGSDVS